MWLFCCFPFTLFIFCLETAQNIVESKQAIHIWPYEFALEKVKVRVKTKQFQENLVIQANTVQIRKAVGFKSLWLSFK